jgi:hypothetical protein
MTSQGGKYSGLKYIMEYNKFRCVGSDRIKCVKVIVDHFLFSDYVLWPSTR